MFKDKVQSEVQRLNACWNATQWQLVKAARANGDRLDTEGFGYTPYTREAPSPKQIPVLLLEWERRLASATELWLRVLTEIQSAELQHPDPHDRNKQYDDVEESWKRLKWTYHDLRRVALAIGVEHTKWSTGHKWDGTPAGCRDALDSSMHEFTAFAFYERIRSYYNRKNETESERLESNRKSAVRMSRMRMRADYRTLRHDIDEAAQTGQRTHLESLLAELGSHLHRMAEASVYPMDWGSDRRNPDNLFVELDEISQDAWSKLAEATVEGS